jgi:hypothetical protein
LTVIQVWLTTVRISLNVIINVPHEIREVIIIIGCPAFNSNNYHWISSISHYHCISSISHYHCISSISHYHWISSISHHHWIFSANLAGASLMQLGQHTPADMPFMARMHFHAKVWKSMTNTENAKVFGLPQPSGGSHSGSLLQNEAGGSGINSSWTPHIIQLLVQIVNSIVGKTKKACT